MSGSAFRQLLGEKRPKQPRVAVVTSVSPADAQCTVLVSGGEVVADLNDQTVDLVAVGTVVTLLPIGDTYEVISTRGGTGTGGIGTSLGPELLPNGSFEYGDSNPTGWSWYPWVAGDYLIARDATPAQSVSGDARMLVTLSPGADAPKVDIWPTIAARVDAGTTYVCSVWVKASAIEASLVTTLRVITGPSDAATSYFGAGSVTTDIATVGGPGGSYQLLTGPVTVPVGHTYARPFLHAEADAAIAASVSVSWDVASLRQRITS